MTLQSKIDILSNAAAAVQAVENMAFGGSAPPSGPQKMQAAVALLSALSPHAAAVLGPLEIVLQGVYNLMKLFGTLHRGAAPADPATPARQAGNLSNETQAG